MSHEPTDAFKTDSALTDAYQPGAVKRDSEQWGLLLHKGRTHVHKDPAVAAHYIIYYKILCYCLQTMFQVGYTEGVAICISTSCPDAVNLKAKHNPLVFLFPPPPFFNKPHTHPLTHPSSHPCRSWPEIARGSRDLRWQKRGAVTRAGNANSACNYV